MTDEDIETIAKICHAANRAYCQTLGDMSQPIWECSSGEIRSSAIAGVKAILDNPSLSPEQSHEKWCEFKIGKGWKYADKKNEAKREHPCLMPYAKLSPQQKLKDKLFGQIVRAFL